MASIRSAMKKLSSTDDFDADIKAALDDASGDDDDEFDYDEPSPQKPNQVQRGLPLEVHESAEEENEAEEGDPHEVYDLKEKLSDNVYLATYKPTGDPYAIKIQEVPTPDLALQLVDEVEKLRDDALGWMITYNAAHKKGNDVWIVMESCAGGSALDAAIFLEGLTEIEVKVILFQAALMLHTANQDGQTHGNIKANNLMLCDDGWVHLADGGGIIGAAKSNEWWQAPELIHQQEDAPVRAQSDIWSLGVAACELTNYLPFLQDPEIDEADVEEQMESLQKKLEAHTRPTFRDDLSEDFRNIVNAMLEYDVEKRPTPEAVATAAYFSDLDEESSKAVIRGIIKNYEARTAELKKEYPHPFPTIRKSLLDQLIDGSAYEEDEMTLQIHDRKDFSHVVKEGDVEGKRVHLKKLERAQVYVFDVSLDATIEDCVDCTVVIGPSKGTVRIANCSHCIIVAACNILRVESTEDSTFNVFTAQGIMFKDCRSNVVGNWNVAYPNLRSHFAAAGLSGQRNAYSSNLSVLGVGSPASSDNCIEAMRILKPRDFTITKLPVGDSAAETIEFECEGEDEEDSLLDEPRTAEVPGKLIIKGKNGESLEHIPGDVDGAFVDIVNNENCDITVIDSSSGALVQDCRQCTIIVGPSSGKVRIEDCADCILSVAARDLEVIRCSGTLYLHCTNPPLVESSHIMVSGWNVSAPMLKELFASCQLPKAQCTLPLGIEKLPDEDFEDRKFQFSENPRCSILTPVNPCKPDVFPLSPTSQKKKQLPPLSAAAAAARGDDSDFSPSSRSSTKTNEKTPKSDIIQSSSSKKATLLSKMTRMSNDFDDDSPRSGSSTGKRDDIDDEDDEPRPSRGGAVVPGSLPPQPGTDDDETLVDDDFPDESDVHNAIGTTPSHRSSEASEAPSPPPVPAASESPVVQKVNNRRRVLRNFDESDEEDGELPDAQMKSTNPANDIKVEKDDEFDYDDAPTPSSRSSGVTRLRERVESIPKLLDTESSDGEETPEPVVEIQVAAVPVPPEVPIQPPEKPTKPNVFENLEDCTLYRWPGSINGKQVVGDACQRCTIVVIDIIDSVTLDDMIDCDIVVAAVEGSVFIRNSRGCTLSACCQQLRTRDCQDLSIRLHITSDPIIETSHGIKFNTWNISAPNLEELMKKAHLDPVVNRYQLVHDFSKDDKRIPQPHWELEDLEAIALRDLEGGGDTEIPQQMLNVLSGMQSPVTTKMDAPASTILSLPLGTSQADAEKALAAFHQTRLSLGQTAPRQVPKEGTRIDADEEFVISSDGEDVESMPSPKDSVPKIKVDYSTPIKKEEPLIISGETGIIITKRAVPGGIIHILGLKKCKINILCQLKEVLITECIDCDFSLGPVSGTVKLADCERGTATVACKKVFFTDCNDISAFLFTIESPTIERSTRLRFAPYNIAYPGALGDFELSALKLDINRYQCVEDLSERDASLTHVHFSLLPLGNGQIRQIKDDTNQNAKCEIPDQLGKVFRGDTGSIQERKVICIGSLRLSPSRRDEKISPFSSPSTSPGAVEAAQSAAAAALAAAAMVVSAPKPSAEPLKPSLSSHDEDTVVQESLCSFQFGNNEDEDAAVESDEEQESDTDAEVYKLKCKLSQCSAIEDEIVELTKKHEQKMKAVDELLKKILGGIGVTHT